MRTMIAVRMAHPTKIGSLAINTGGVRMAKLAG